MAWPYLMGIIKIVVTYGFNGTPSINVHFVLQRAPASPISSGDLVTAANTMHAALSAEWKNQMGDEWTIDNITAQDWTVEDGEQIPTNQTLPINGSEVAPAIPASVALVVSHRTDHTGRSRRGRTYLPGLTEGNVDFNTVDALGIADAIDTFTAWDSNLDAQELDHVVYSLYSAGVERVTPLATLVTSRIVNDRVDTQRRRLPS